MRTIGAEEFFTNKEAYGDYWDIQPPEEFAWIFQVFMELYRTVDERISFPDISAWQKVRGIRLSQYEVTLIMAMNGWAASEIAKLRDSED